jgi:16S rRNA (adenine1518-N6/adenine1519-N6)-dimethyltransferase
MIPAKKSLGQNFLHSMGAVNAMVEASRVTKEDIVLEIGPGKGVLTEFLLKTGAQVIAVEKDDRMIPHLSERFGGEVTSGKLKLIHGDILDISPKELGLLANKYKLVANIPYYITGELIQKFLETDSQPSLMTLMLQKEVARRIVAKDGKESILSLSVKAYGSPKYIQTVSAGSFNPVPSVDSAILLIDNISSDFTDKNTEKMFFKVIKAGFAHKRKKLIRNLEIVAEKNILENTFSTLQLDVDTRAEDLDLKQWKTLAQKLA